MRPGWIVDDSSAGMMMGGDDDNRGHRSFSLTTIHVCVRHVSFSLGSSILPFSLCLPSHRPVSACFEHDISMTPFEGFYCECALWCRLDIMTTKA